MTMQLRVVHRTGFTYDGGAVASYNEARMTPVNSIDQLVLHTRLDVSPTPWSYGYQDYWGTQVVAFEVHEVHSDLVVTATSTVEVTRPPSDADGATWRALRDPGLRDEFCEYLEVTPVVASPLDLLEEVDEARATTQTPGAFARAMCEKVHGSMEYVTGSTDLTTTAAQAWENRRGVCQDMVHVSLGMLRRAGVPARYVSGYLHPSKDPEVGEPVEGESHAWVEYWDGHWVAFDPTNNREPGDQHVVIGRGREYADVAPLRGIFSGGTTSDMNAAVTITRVR